MDNPKITEKQPKSWIYRSDYSIFESWTKYSSGPEWIIQKLLKNSQKAEFTEVITLFSNLIF